MAVGSFFQMILQATGILWILLNVVMMAAAWLLFLADRRAHTLCLLIGYGILFLGGLLMRFYPMVLGSSAPADYDPTKFFALTQGFTLIGGALVAYGLFNFALIHYRKSRQPTFPE